MTTHQAASLIVIILIFNVPSTKATIDVNLPELEYLANHLDPQECRRLAAALRYDAYELPLNLVEAAEKIDKNLSCLRRLLHWNNGNGEGRGKTHELLERRLRQIGRIDLADWLGKTVFKELGKDLIDVVDATMETALMTTSIGYTDIDSQSTETIVNHNDDDDENFWLIIDTIIAGLFAAFVFMLVALLGFIVIDRIARCRCCDL